MTDMFYDSQDELQAQRCKALVVMNKDAVNAFKELMDQQGTPVVLNTLDDEKEFNFSFSYCYQGLAKQSNVIAKLKLVAKSFGETLESLDDLNDFHGYYSHNDFVFYLD